MSFPLGRQIEITPNHLAYRLPVAGNVKVQPAVVVIVKKPHREAPDRPLDVHLPGDLAERPVPVMVIEEILLALVGDVQFRVAIIVKVAPKRALCECAPVDSGEM